MNHCASVARRVLAISSRGGRRRVPLATVAALVMIAGAAVASPARADDGQGDPPDTAGPSVARVSLTRGAVSIKRGDSSDDVEATANAPLLEADYLSTGTDGRAEVQYDGISLLRLDANTQVRFTSLDAGKREAQLAEGTVEISELQGDDGRPQLDTPSISLQPMDTGSYRVTVTPDGTTYVSVRSGRIAVLTPGNTNEVDAGQSIVAQGGADDPNVQSTDTPQEDDFDRFNGERDRFEMQELGQTNVDPQTDGGDLGRYGTWQNVPSYGRVWHPTEDADWAPYHDGRWVWEDAYGWTWVAAEPWGWAPYHYGRWFYNAGYGGWLWTPPVYAPAYAYAPVPQAVFWRPALVSFFGFGFGGGSGVSLSVGFGNVGWVPLAPNEVYHPWYGAGNGWNGRGGRPYGGNGGTNVTSVTNITNVTNINYGNITRNYANANAPGAIATVDTRRFLEGNYRPTTVNVTTLRTANVGAFRGPLPLAPTRQNLTFTGHPAPRTDFRPIRAQETFAGHAPATNRYRFNDQRTEITNNLQSHNLPVRPDAFTQSSTLPSAPNTGARYPLGGNRGENGSRGGTGYQPGTPGGYRGEPGTTGGYRGTPTTTGGYRGEPGTTGGYRGTPTTTGGYRGEPSTTGGYRGTPTTTGGYRGEPGTTGGGYRGTPTTTGGYRGEPSTTTGGGYRGTPSTTGGYGGTPTTTGGYRGEPGTTGGYRGAPGTTTGGGYRGTPTTTGGYRGAPGTGGGYRGAPDNTTGGGYRGTPGTNGGYRPPSSGGGYVRPATHPTLRRPIPTTTTAPARPN